MAPTIKDVAAAANVATSTVSRVISDHPRISIETKRRVRQAMEELGYHPNFQAKSLAKSSTQTIGVVMPDSTDRVFQNPFFPEVIRGISSYAHTKDYALFLSTGSTAQEIFEGVVKMVQGKRVDGFIILYSRLNDPILNYLRKENFPFVVVGKPYKNVDEINHVDNDNIKAGKELTDYFIQRGHDRIAFVGGSPDLVVTIDRLEGYRQALQNAGLPVLEDYIICEKDFIEGGEEAALELLDLKARPAALLVSDDLLALGVIKALKKKQLRIPEDCSIISFNNVLIAELSQPALSSVDIQVYQLGYQAGKCLIERMKEPNEPTKRIILPYHLVERESCM